MSAITSSISLPVSTRLIRNTKAEGDRFSSLVLIASERHLPEIPRLGLIANLA
ncbi:hypothetical protein [Bradyrhizobium sp. Ash2021]|uniref:hypothetical protein n=1 Tax=Bradyrhizobium sp. Ash2021 TaxID=2954771 RepID=UPI00281504CF|nr:hypothetical protein [Bradyrhizobium sp. Ash2021]WMT73846.1 hypothetical protein NL528_38985 [Bradyrhizobium sp. Ash2021]